MKKSRLQGLDYTGWCQQVVDNFVASGGHAFVNDRRVSLLADPVAMLEDFLGNAVKTAYVADEESDAYAGQLRMQHGDLTKEVRTAAQARMRASWIVFGPPMAGGNHIFVTTFDGAPGVYVHVMATSDEEADARLNELLSAMKTITS